MFCIGEVSNAEMLANIFGCPLEVLPTSYLGLPLGAIGSRVGIWDPVIQLVERKLETWKARFLSFGARLTMVKSVLASLPVYFMSLFKAPASVTNSLERLQRRFLWSGVGEKERIHWISWSKVKTARELGGLGVQDLQSLNLALLSKWVWRFGTERSAWWRCLIKVKCGGGPSEWQPTWGFRSAGCSIWKWVVLYSFSFWLHGHVDPGGGCMCVLV
ncbi:Putative ribonuclease H protein At1g65750 [Linum perenne]